MQGAGNVSVSQTKTRSYRRRLGLSRVFDSLCWVVALTTSVVVRYQVLENRQVQSLFLLLAFAIVIAAQLIIGQFTLYRWRWRTGSFEESTAVAVTTGAAGTVLLVIALLGFRSSISIGSVFSAVPLCVVLALGGRTALRAHKFSEIQSAGSQNHRAVIFGAGNAGAMLVEALLSMPDRKFEPVALADDDAAKVSLRIRHVKVEGTSNDICPIAHRFDASVVIIAISDLDSRVLRRVVDQAKSCGLQIEIMPSLTEVYADRAKISDVRPLALEDLLRRDEIRTSRQEVRAFLQNRRVLVTGAGGSIGSELCRQISTFDPEALIMLDRDESALHQVQLSIEGRALLNTRNLVVCDVRDQQGLESVFAEHHPHVVFHAAALKHLPLLEMWPAEAIKSNVWGTQNVLDAAVASDVECFVNISTDKAADPISVLGYSKRVAERLTSTVGEQSQGRFLSVRFGNVLGSRGSMLGTFQDQIENGGPVTVTHPDVSRYFMTISEAVELSLQAGAIGRTGEVLVLDMGEPVRIDDVARQLIFESGREIEISYVGLRDGEKLHEDLFGINEFGARKVHSVISSVTVPIIDLRVVEELVVVGSPAQISSSLAAVCHTPMK